MNVLAHRMWGSNLLGRATSEYAIAADFPMLAAKP
jgi:hypothetical protein